ncbi:hypothetical protein JCM11491_002232 [Sporobolomyces phaffii]
MCDSVRHPRSSTPFFRASGSPSSSSTSSSSSDDRDSSDDSDGDDDNDDEPYWSSSGASAATRVPHSETLPSSASRPLQSRASLRLSIAYLSARQSLAALSFDALSSSLTALSALLPEPSQSSWESVSIFVPLLARFAKDLDMALTSQDTADRRVRRSMPKEDAKAFVRLLQRWEKVRAAPAATERFSSRKGKGKDSEFSWVHHVEDLVAKCPPPKHFSDPEYALEMPKLLASVESILLPSCSIPRLSLANLGLTSARLGGWDAFRQLQETVEWYLGFAGSSGQGEPEEQAKELLAHVKSLDLSRNRLSSIPSWLPELFPSLETLSLSHNDLYHLPPNVMLFSNLRRLRTHGNHLVSSDKALLPLKVDSKREAKQRHHGTRANSKRLVHSLMNRPLSNPPPATSLFRSAVELVLLARDSVERSMIDLSPPDLPPHLAEIVSDSYLCVACRSLVLATSEDADRYVDEPAYERVHFVSPGIVIPKLTSRHRQLTRGRSEDLDPSDSTDLASLEQVALLTLYNRHEAQPPTRPQLAGARSDGRRHGEVASGSIARGLHTIVIGGRGARYDEGDSRYCVGCLRKHLGVDRGGACQCRVCSEERRVTGGASDREQADRDEGDRVLRWLRRKERVRGDPEPNG